MLQRVGLGCNMLYDVQPQWRRYSGLTGSADHFFDFFETLSTLKIRTLPYLDENASSNSSGLIDVPAT